MITASDVARRASHALTQPLDLDVDPGYDAPTAADAEVSELEAHAPYSGQTQLANLVIWRPRLEPSAAFHELDALRSDDRLALQAIRRLETTEVPYKIGLEARLEDLLRAYQEDYEGRSLSASAIDIFVNFLNAYPYLKRPRLSATPFGDLYAEWTAPADILFGVRFMPSGEVQYVILTPNPLHKGRTDRSSGRTTVDALMEKLNHLRDQRWFME